MSAVYLHMTVKIRAGVPFGKYRKLFAQVKPVLEKNGWALRQSLVNLSGRVNTVVNIWEVPDYGNIEQGLFDPALREHLDSVREIVEEEVMTLMLPNRQFDAAAPAA